MSKVKFGTVKWRADKGKWRARYIHRGDRSEKLFDTERQAWGWLAEEAKRVLENTWASPRLGAVPFAEVLEAWWETREVEPGTAVRDASVITTWVLPFFGDLRLSDIDYDTMSRFVKAMSQEGRSPAHVRKAYQLTRQVLKYAVKRKFLGAMPVEADNLPPVRRHPLEVLTLEEVWAVADAIEPRYRALVVTGGYSGARLGELLGLRMVNLDLGLHRVMHVVEDLENVQGRVRIGAPLKNEGSRRSIPLPQVVINELITHLDRFEPSEDGLVFTSPRGGPIRIDTWRRRYWRPATEAALGRYIPPYRLRHSQATELLARGASVDDVAARLGNSPRVVLDTYSQHLQSRDRMVADLLEKATEELGLGGAGPTWPHSGPTFIRERGQTGTNQESRKRSDQGF